MSTPYVRCLVLWAWAWALCGSVHAEEAPYRQEVVVSGPTRLDWTFALANQSVVEPPAEWLAGYESTQQRYELFVPPKGKDRKSGHPVVLFISAGDGPAGWGPLEAVCRSQGILFASPHGAGNNTSMPRRVRIVLDVLDDIRRSHPVDPDRTYLAGFSGGGRVACAITFALPELFGGVMPVCAGGELRDEPWLRHRAIERLNDQQFRLGREKFKLDLFEKRFQVFAAARRLLSHVLTDANLDETNLSGDKGFETVRGRDTIRNLDRAIRILFFKSLENSFEDVLSASHPGQPIMDETHPRHPAPRPT